MYIYHELIDGSFHSIFQIIFREENPGVEYEYWFYPSQKPAQRQQPSTYQSGELSENQIVGK